MAKIKDQWQDVDTVLALFGKQKYAARKKYKVFVEKGILEGVKSELTGGEQLVSEHRLSLYDT